MRSESGRRQSTSPSRNTRAEREPDERARSRSCPRTRRHPRAIDHATCWSRSRPRSTRPRAVVDRPSAICPAAPDQTWTVQSPDADRTTHRSRVRRVAIEPVSRPSGAATKSSTDRARSATLPSGRRDRVRRGVRPRRERARSAQRPVEAPASRAPPGERREEPKARPRQHGRTASCIATAGDGPSQRRMSRRRSRGQAERPELVADEVQTASRARSRWPAPGSRRPRPARARCSTRRFARSAAVETTRNRADPAPDVAALDAERPEPVEE